jgi:hypothetical protein
LQASHNTNKYGKKREGKENGDPTGEEPKLEMPASLKVGDWDLR